MQVVDRDQQRPVMQHHLPAAQRHLLMTILREDYTQNSGVHKIGLGNVRKRIQDTFGERYTLVVKSEVGKGTQVIMTVPYIKIQKVE